ncbi:MAG: hypothetical protein ABI672_12830 [Vicinamibacteria bacterium]
MADISWQPDGRKPPDFAWIEAEIERVARGGVVRLTLAKGGWRVRALLPASMCSRGVSAADRDVSEQVIEVLLNYGCKVESLDP